MRKFNVDFLIIRNKAKLESMIKKDEDYKKILRQSRRLDKYVNIKMKELVK